MKKTYQTPEMTVVQIATVGMLALSGGERYSNESASGGDQMSREGSAWGWMDE